MRYISDASWRELIRQLTIIALDNLVTKAFSCNATKEGKLLPPFYIFIKLVY
ncbi:hypothetical protein [Nostoc sp.]|uniref:hypothetical protein n=1 Tax=Nostoc sp. TaxID=1180 RepID=UPI002FF7FC97